MSYSRLNKTFYRTGPDYRFDDQVDFDEIKQTFGFKTMTLGAWVTKEEKYIAANLIYDALADLAQILSLPPKAIGLRGTLNFAFGSGGRQGVQAHYCRSTKTLALAKNAGGGALAHEWWHAFDNYITAFLFPDTNAKFASSAWLKDQSLNPHPLNHLLDKFYQHTFLEHSGQMPSPFFVRSQSIDKALKQIYYALPEELTARMFEYIIHGHTSIKNEFLVSGLNEPALKHTYPNKSDAEQAGLFITQYFNGLGKLLYRQLM